MGVKVFFISNSFFSFVLSSVRLEGDFSLGEDSFARGGLLSLLFISLYYFHQRSQHTADILCEASNNIHQIIIMNRQFPLDKPF